ncbi:uncharacterized protein HMPREF1541_00157 [Cyphellophora europaea CBS 101466]|uniref:Uncharacterized protein n=1 Tax=Cyphellophora europaea (strain CBS 101466) TaxID=1220924 RepID=W2SBJ3_CYPE1|nr:uncharacterized protein HMPREF1541_00157 [Cyphellophora europaea CBS 101466]ETN45975.1 hypothetical protein HMPREF1541_00157 [Cyphellophora europaea CBS 101466]
MAQGNSWSDAAISTAQQQTTTITKTLELIHTQTMYGTPPSSNSTTWASTTSSSTIWSVPSKTSSSAVLAESSSPVVAESTPARTTAPAVATPAQTVSGVAPLKLDAVLAVVAAGAVAFWTS